MPEYIVLATEKEMRDLGVYAEAENWSEAVRIRDQTGGEIYEHIPRATPLANLLWWVLGRLSAGAFTIAGPTNLRIVRYAFVTQ